MTPAPMFESGPLRLLPAPLREPRRAWLVLRIAWLLSFGGSVLLSYGAQRLAPGLAEPKFALSGLSAFLLLALFAPIIETLIMALVLTVLAHFAPPTATVLISALLWGIAHSLQAPAWGLVIWWPFLIFSTLYLVWRQRGVVPALAMAATAHILQNLAPALMVSKLV